MIMTENPGVRLSARGGLLVLALAAMAGLSTPAWSCDPPDGGKAKTCGTTTPAVAPLVEVMVTPQVRLAGDPQPPVSNAEVRRLSAELERLRAELADLEARLHGAQGGHGGGMSFAPGTPMPSMPSLPPMPPGRPMARTAPRSPAPFAQGGDAECNREYSLSDEKADALFELLSPSDVTVVVSRTGDGVSIRGRQNQCEVMDRFIDLYTRGQREGLNTYGETIERWQSRWDSDESYSVPEDRADAVYAVLAFDDVPVLVSRSGDGISVKATGADQRTVADLVNIVSGQGPSLFAPGQGRNSFQTRSWRGDKDAPEAEDRSGIAGNLMQLERQAQQQRGEIDRAPREVEREVQQQMREAQRELEEQRRETDRARREVELDVQQQMREAQRELEEQKREMEREYREAQREAEQAARGRGGSWAFGNADGEDEEEAPEADEERGERRYQMPKERAELLFNLLAPQDVEVFVSWQGDELVVTGNEEDLDSIDDVVEIVTRNLGRQERAEFKSKTDVTNLISALVGANAAANVAAASAAEVQAQSYADVVAAVEAAAVAEPVAASVEAAVAEEEGAR